MNVLAGVVIGECLPRHRHEEFLKFLRKIDREVPKGLAVHMILDNYATHKHPDVVKWLDKHQRFHLHFTPTSSSWLNLVERWFRELTDLNPWIESVSCATTRSMKPKSGSRASRSAQMTPTGRGSGVR